MVSNRLILFHCSKNISSFTSWYYRFTMYVSFFFVFFLPLTGINSHQWRDGKDPNEVHIGRLKIHKGGAFIGYNKRQEAGGLYIHTGPNSKE